MPTILIDEDEKRKLNSLRGKKIAETGGDATFAQVMKELLKDVPLPPKKTKPKNA